MGAGAVVVAPTRVEEALDWVDLGTDAWANMQPTCGPIVPVEDWADSAPSLLDLLSAGQVSGGAAPYFGARRIRVDGDEFFRAVYLRVVERAVLHRDAVAIHKLARALDSCTSDEETVVVDLLHGMARRLEHATGTPAASSHRARASAAESAVQYFVVHPSLDAVTCSLLRKASAAYITANPSTQVDGTTYAAFVGGTLGLDMEEYCEECVCPLGTPVDTIMMDAVCRALQVGVTLSVLPPREGSTVADRPSAPSPQGPAAITRAVGVDLGGPPPSPSPTQSHIHVVESEGSVYLVYAQ